MTSGICRFVIRGVAQPGSASALGAECRRFKSSRPDHIALAEAATREKFDDLEFLVNWGLCELNGVKNVVTLARRLA